MIKLVTKPYDYVGQRIDYMMGHEDGIKEIFYTKRSRLWASEVSSLIVNNETEVGFLNLVPERIRNILFVDEGIISRYREFGYGRQAIEHLIENTDFPEYLIGETRKDNVPANASASKIGTLIAQTDILNFYLFDNDRKNDFINSYEYEQLIKVKTLKK